MSGQLPGLPPGSILRLVGQIYRTLVERKESAIAVVNLAGIEEGFLVGRCKLGFLLQRSYIDPGLLLDLGFDESLG